MKPEDSPIRVLFLCTSNACRSQMAEAFARVLGKGRVESFSAGTFPLTLDPLTVQVMSEVGIDISAQHSKSVDTFAGEPFDFVITVCDRAKESCPVWPGARQKLHWSFEDPADAEGTEDERTQVYARVRDEIQDHVQTFLSHPKVP